MYQYYCTSLGITMFYYLITDQYMLILMCVRSVPIPSWCVVLWLLCQSLYFAIQFNTLSDFINDTALKGYVREIYLACVHLCHFPFLDGLVVCHLPFGPTAYFTLCNVVMRHDVPDIGTMSEAYPHLIFHNFTSRLGRRVRGVQ